MSISPLHWRPQINYQPPKTPLLLKFEVRASWCCPQTFPLSLVLQIYTLLAALALLLRNPHPPLPWPMSSPLPAKPSLIA